MVKKILPLFFLVLGPALICLGILNSYTKKSAEKGVAPPPQEVYETYTLENDRYEGEFSPKTEFKLLNEADSALILKEEVPTVNHYNEAGFAREFDMLDQAEEENSSGTGFLPALMVFSGTFFLTFGFILIRRKA